MKLSELKNVPAPDLFTMWMRAEFPFDAASCRLCVTQHGYELCEIHQELSKLSASVKNCEKVKDNLEQIFALRLFFADLYLTPVPQDALEEERGFTVAARDLEVIGDTRR